MDTMIDRDGRQMVVIHFVVPRFSADENASVEGIACNEEIDPRGKGYHRTNDPRAATCLACRATEKFMLALRGQPIIRR